VPGGRDGRCWSAVASVCHRSNTSDRFHTFLQVCFWLMHAKRYSPYDTETWTAARRLTWAIKTVQRFLLTTKQGTVDAVKVQTIIGFHSTSQYEQGAQPLDLMSLRFATWTFGWWTMRPDQVTPRNKMLNAGERGKYQRTSSSAENENAASPCLWINGTPFE
jgi:hypothetical protein